jgi:ABC-2 type transport system permease protein
MAPGILAQSVLFVAIFYGIAAIWERDLGIIQKFLASPLPRSSIVVGKALSASERALVQTVIVYSLSVLLGVKLNYNIIAILSVVAIVSLGSALFSTFSLIIACIVKTRERFMGMGQVLTMPLFFASNAIYPISLMPPWLQAMSAGNPLSYVVDALRAMLLTGNYSGLGVDILALSIFTVIFVGAASVAIKRMVE